MDLVILSAHRLRKTAEANAARARNPNAVASFSAHSLGLAVDFDMSHRNDIKFSGLSTRPMSELVRMRESPWCINGCSCAARSSAGIPTRTNRGIGQDNPPGFREIFWADFPGGAPERGIIIEEP